jgi:hypothetical protein
VFAAAAVGSLAAAAVGCVHPDVVAPLGFMCAGGFLLAAGGAAVINWLCAWPPEIRCYDPDAPW